MAKNEHLKHILRTEDTLPESMSWESMQSSILSKVDSADQIEARERKFKLRMFLISLGTIATILTLFLLNHNTQQNTIANKPQNIKSDNLAKKVQTPTSSDVSSEAIKEEAAGLSSHINKKNNEIKNTLSKDITQASSTLSKEKFASTSYNYQSDNRDNKENFVVTLENTSLLQKQSNTPVELSSTNNSTAATINPLTKNSVPFKSSQITENSKRTIAISPAFLNTQAKKLMVVERKVRAYKFSLSSPKIPTETIIQKPKHHSIEIGLGANLFSPNFGNTALGEVKSSFTSGSVGFAGEVIFDYALSSKWSINTGLAYQTLNSTFDYHNEKEVLENTEVVTLIEVNAISKDSTRHFANEDVEAVFWQRILHYNSTKLVSIPVLINRKWNLGQRFQLTTGAGLQFNALSFSNGKAIISDQGEFSTYEVVSYENELYNIQSKFHALVSTGINYKLNDKSYFGLSLNGSYSLNDWSSDLAYSSKPWVLASKFRVGRRF